MGSKRDYYEVLGVSKDADDTTLKAAYRKLALRYHPDRNPGDKVAEDKFKEAAEAYEVLRDPGKRQIYDQYGHQGLEGSGFSGFSGFEDIFSSVGDIFEEFFGFGGGRKSKQRMRRGADLRHDLTLNFMDAVFGTETEITIQKNELCQSCSGKGTAPGTEPETCTYCRGTGQISRAQGFFTVRSSCPYCNGHGKVITKPCPGCRGAGQTRIKKKVTVKIPAGVDSGSRLRLTGEGEGGGEGVLPGDLYVFIHVRPHEFFERDGTNTLCNIKITFVQAALGDTIQVPTLTGEKPLTIPKGCQPGDILKFSGEGIPSLRNGVRGDQIMRMDVRTPTSLTKKQETLLREFANLESGKLSQKLKNLLKGNIAQSS